jgi:hypothetical protein
MIILKKEFSFWMIFMLIITPGVIFSQNAFTFDKYHINSEVREFLNELRQIRPDQVKLHTLATSPGGEPVTVIEIGADKTDVPAIFAGANFEGNMPLAVEGALKLARMIIDSAKYTSSLKWYILPLPNPDAAKGFFEDIKYNRSVNDFSINDDADDSVNEDGYDDLNGDGFITFMRKKSMEGTHIISHKDTRIMVKADIDNAERGKYRLYTEGVDNDGDGEYNEDGEGGINPGITFPHLFPADKKEAGLWPGQSPEVYGIMKFIYDHPEIIMVYTLGSSDFCLVPPKAGRKGDTSSDKVKIPARYARMFGVDASETFTMDEVIDMFREHVPDGERFTPHTVANILGLGAAVNPLKRDLEFYEKFSVEYKKYLKSKNFNLSRLDPQPAKNGSFELWAYYHLGVPSFSMNLFRVPKTDENNKTKDHGFLSLDEVRDMDSEEFLKLDKEKIATFLKSDNATEKYNAVDIVDMIKSGKTTPKKLAEMLEELKESEKEKKFSQKDKALLAWSEKEWDGNGFADWQKYDHPELGEVEIGGFIPYFETTPKPVHIDSLLDIQLPWLLHLTEKLPRIAFADEKITDLGAGVYKLELFVENRGYLPYPIAMGQRNNQPAPVVVILEGEFELLEGIKREPLGPIGGNQVKKISWLLRTEKKIDISAKIESAVLGETIKYVSIGG